jgi:SAM-dependent methyltransferase
MNRPAFSAKTEATIRILSDVLPQPPRRILVVGCGTGHEAGTLARAFRADTIGIDLGNQFGFDHQAASPAVLRAMDAQALAFPDASFDLVFSFHALEHIADPRRALAEMARVLCRGGTYFIGTPNKARLVGYIGSATSLRNKVVWNLADLGMRARGRWRNEAGAHAGFTRAELLGLTRTAFGGGQDVTDAYYRALYAKRTRVLDALVRTGLGSRAYPCVYVTGRRSP